MKTSINAGFMPRSRINEILDRVTTSKLVYIVAGAGYGKTQAVRNYIEQQEDAVVRWVQLTESDNVGARYWEHLTHNISQDNPELADRLREFGFPETAARFRQFAEILRGTEHRGKKTFLVLDDFHLIHSKQACKFAERCAHLEIPGACVIIISRTEPDINAVALFSKGQADRVTEEELRFTEQEIAEFFEKENIALPAKTLPQIIDATKGWALAISLLMPILRREPVNISIALDTVKDNIFKLMEREAWRDFPPIKKKAMLKFSLISELPLKALWNYFSKTPLMQDTPQLAPFVWYDSFTGQQRVHPLYWEFLGMQQDMLTEKEKRDTYAKAAKWCFDNNFYLDAVKYLAKSRQYDKVLGVFLSYPHRLPADTCGYYLGVLDSLPHEDTMEPDISYLLIMSIFYPLFLAGTERYDDARAKCYENISKWRKRAEPVAPLIVSISYSNLAYIDMYTCTVSHQYETPKHMKKAAQYAELYAAQGERKKKKISTLLGDSAGGAFSIADIRSFACLVGEGAEIMEFDKFIAMAKQTAAYIDGSTQNMYYGYFELVLCEIAFYKNKPEDAKKYAYDAIMKAREKKQHSIEAMAAMYLFRIAMLEGNYPMVQELFREKERPEGGPDFWNRKFLYELGIGLLYAQIGLPGKVPAWLIADDKDSMLEVSVHVRELICAAKYHISAKNYDRALAMLSSAYPRKPQERFALGELTLFLLTAVARLKTGDLKGAAADFERAYELSYDCLFEMPFIELGKDLHPLITEAAKKEDTIIPVEKFRQIEKKASVYAKKTTVILNAFRLEKNIEEIVELTERELEVLTDLYHGLSREEISVTRYLSINTVHKIIQAVYHKLNAYGKADAIRIAVDKHILE